MTNIIQRVALPTDGNGYPMQISPNKVALAVTYDATISTSTAVTLNANTSFIEVTAIDKAICLKWGTASASTSAWDHVIPANWIQSFSVPVDSTTGSLYTTVNFIEESATAKLAVSEF